ncbi:MAG: site-2 protease family protein [bacterium]|nr:site-2 protease family protein [bacterium]
MTILVFIVVLVVLIVVHEFGHFVVAKLSGMRVDEFGLGYPPRAAILGRVGETLLTLNWIPFGGFVKIHGEDAIEEEGKDPRAFSSKPRHIQAIVLVAGIAMNLLLALIIFTGLLMTPHRISDHEIASPLPLISALVKGAEVTWHVTAATAVGLAHFFAGVLTFSADLSQVTGPVGIAGAVGAAAQSGWQSLLSLTALISVNLALINLIPIPALDGGRLLFVIIEAIIRRPIKPIVAQTVNAAGFAFLILLMVVVTLHDVYKIIG